MTDLLFALVMLGTVTVIGWPFLRLLPGDRAGRWLAAPVLGFGGFAVATSILYRLGVTPALGGAAVLACGAVAMLATLRGSRARDAGAAWLALGALSVLLLVLAPGWTGGEQFRVFQGNDQDQWNYIAFSAAYRRHAYADLIALAPDLATMSDSLAGAQRMLMARPAVCIAFAALAGWFGLPTPDVAYAWTAGLQVLSFFAVAFLLRFVLGVGAGRAALVAAALALGFHLQYVLDINAWSQLAGMPAGLVSLGLLLRMPEDEGARRRLLLVQALLLAAQLYLYPELLLAYAAPALVIVLIGLKPLAWRERARRLLEYGAMLGLVALACAPMWRATIGTLFAQQRSALRHAFPWWQHFQGYLFGRDLDYFAVAQPGLGTTDMLYALLSLPVDLVGGLLGLHFVLPGAGWPLALRAPWKLALAAAMMALACGAVLALRHARRGAARPDLPRFALLAAVALLVPAGILALGQGWAAGKAWSMVAPLAFLLLALPLAVPGSARWSQALVLASLVPHLALGVLRPFAAMAPGGVHYAAPYPATPNASAKRDIAWTLGTRRAELLGCRAVLLDLGSPVLERYAQVWLDELGLPWTSRRPLNSDYGNGRTLGERRTDATPDCVVTNVLSAAPAGRVIWLGRDLAVPDFLSGGQGRLDLVALGAQMRGLHAAETYQGATLRWTDGDARIELPATVGPPPQALELDLWPVRPAGATLRLEVNGHVLFDGALPDGAWSRRFPLAGIAGAGPLSIRIASGHFQPPGDPRRLGLALRQLVILR